VSATLVIGAVIVVLGAVLLANLFGAADMVIKVVTSRYLGSLPPGFAASPGGFRIYAALIIAIGLIFAGFGLAETNATLGAVVFAIGAIGFIVLSVLVIRGEIATYRAIHASGAKNVH
jgi:hypothetical protein